uniref:Uncharacterized protein n=1 Tax=Plectus sambesii TaxID=2011161 RepID=A0A914W4Y7_9BILA
MDADLGRSLDDEESSAENPTRRHTQCRRISAFKKRRDLLSTSCMWALIAGKTVAWPIFITFLFYTLRSPRNGIEQLYVAVSSDEPERIGYDNFHYLLSLKVAAMEKYHGLMLAISTLSALLILASTTTLYVGCGKDYRMFIPCFIVTTIVAIGLTASLAFEVAVVMDSSLIDDMNELLQRATRWNANTFLVIEESFPCSSALERLRKMHLRKTTIESITNSPPDDRVHPNCDFLTEKNIIEPSVVIAATVLVVLFDAVYLRALYRCYSSIGRKLNDEKPDWSIQFQSLRKRVAKHVPQLKHSHHEVTNMRKLGQGEGLIPRYTSQNWAIM